jgi:hypothetical protein
MTLFSLNGSRPGPLPFRIMLSNGASRTDPASFTSAEIADAGYVEAPAKPASDPATQHAPEWTGTKWTVTDKATEELAADFDAAKEAALQALAQKRWGIETGGILFGGSIPIRTDEVGQAKITGALTLMDKDPTLTEVDWEGMPGVWATIDKATLEAIGIAVGRHVQGCFSRARVVSELIQSANDATDLNAAIAAISEGWPTP